MTLKRTMLVTIACLALSVSTAAASPFNNPPETNDMIPDGGWVGTFPYQRNVLIDFATNPATWPDDANDPTRRELIPETNYHLEGDDDGDLYPSDWFDWSGQLGWYDDDPTQSGRQGLIGFINQEASVFTITLHLDNWPEIEPFKYVYLEMDIYRDGMGDWIGWTEAPSPSVVGSELGTETDLGGGWSRFNVWVPIELNPPWEEITINVHSSEFATGSVLIDYIHVATECVPEPLTASMLLLGGTLLAVRRKR